MTRNALIVFSSPAISCRRNVLILRLTAMASHPQSFLHPCRLVFTLFVALFAGCAPSAPSLPAKTPRVATGTVKLVIDDGSGNPRSYPEIPWAEGDTVLTAMDEATSASKPLRYATIGPDGTAFITRIDDLDNEGTGGRNWIYSVNGKLADRSAALYETRPEDEILWKYTAETPR